jgi:hexosaminidase
MSASLVHEKKIVTGLTTAFKFNKATGKNISLKNPPSKNYPGNGALTLVDGIQNEKGMSRSIEFLGFSGSDLDATIDLGSITDITTVNLHVFDQAGSWIYLPKTVGVTYSNLPDTSVDTNLKTAFSKLDIDPIALAGLKTIKIDSRQSCRYVHIVAKNIGIIPTGNPGSGHPGWLFVDELEIN